MFWEMESVLSDSVSLTYSSMEFRSEIEELSDELAVLSRQLGLDLAPVQDQWQYWIATVIQLQEISQIDKLGDPWLRIGEGHPFDDLSQVAFPLLSIRASETTCERTTGIERRAL
jgi:hypothetical protein